MTDRLLKPTPLRRLPYMKPSERRDALWRRIMERVEIDPQTGCWNWTGPTSGRDKPGCRKARGRGYGRLSLGGKTVAVHRAVYELVHGPLGGWTVDHTCGNRLCCNPDHLEAVTHKQNCKRRDAKRGAK